MVLPAFRRTPSMLASATDLEMPSVTNAVNASCLRVLPGEPPKIESPEDLRSLSRSSKISRWAVFPPIPLTACRVRASSRKIASRSSAGGREESMTMAVFGPTPFTEMRFKNNSFSASVEKPKSRCATSRTWWYVTSWMSSRSLMFLYVQASRGDKQSCETSWVTISFLPPGRFLPALEHPQQQWRSCSQSRGWSSPIAGYVRVCASPAIQGQ